MILELGGFPPIGMMEYWKVGIMCSGKMEMWAIDKIHFDNEVKKIHK